MTNADIAALANAAAAQTDHTKAPEAKEFEREVAAPGKGIMRFREYIEIGEHPNASKAYPDKKPSRKARFVFELCTPRHIQVIPVEGKDDLIIPHVLGVTVAMPDTGKPAHAKSAYAKLFAKLNYDGKLQHPAQALGRAYVVDILAGYDADSYEGAKLKEGAKQKYANFKDADGSFLISPPRVEDPLSGVVTELNVPEIKGALKIFLYDNPSKVTWDSLFIDGEYEKEEKGVKVKVSKNWIQETIKKALDFTGSKVHQLLEAGDPNALDNLPTGTDKVEVKTEVSTPATADPLAAFGI